MPKIKLIISIGIFSILLSVASAIKNQTRIIEKSIYKIENTQIDITKLILGMWILQI